MTLSQNNSFISALREKLLIKHSGNIILHEQNDEDTETFIVKPHALMKESKLKALLIKPIKRISITFDTNIYIKKKATLIILEKINNLNGEIPLGNVRLNKSRQIIYSYAFFGPQPDANNNTITSVINSIERLVHQIQSDYISEIEGSLTPLVMMQTQKVNEDWKSSEMFLDSEMLKLEKLQSVAELDSSNDKVRFINFV